MQQAKKKMVEKFNPGDLHDLSHVALAPTWGNSRWAPTWLNSCPDMLPKLTN